MEVASFACFLLAGFNLSLIKECLLSSPNAARDYLVAHNAVRAKVGVGPMTWDNNVAAYARNYANKRAGDCKLIHSGGRYGENLSMSSGPMSIAAAVNLWIKEKPFYNRALNSCQGGQCLHYTQMVWRKSVRLGCAKVNCRNGGTFVICSYDPPGNIIGQRPY